ncbi:MAG: NO-inducible flavohemoprotein [Pseudomonadota bacterium]
MLNQQTRDLVKATAPILKVHGLVLTKHFYARMFDHNPELKSMFNQGNQQSGSQQQSLALAVAAYAENIDDPSVLVPVLKMVANKHVSLGIRAEHYPIVGKHLLASIKVVLGDAASDELINAWALAYGQLADLLIGFEQAIYQEAASQQGGWTAWRGFKVTQKIVESDEITSFYLQPADGGGVPDYRAGQYVSVKVFVPALGIYQPRQYSLSSAPNGRYFRISVKRELGGNIKPEGMVSNILHSSVHEGAIIEVSPPMGDFYLHEDRDTSVVLLSAGVGITPTLAMLEQLVEKKSARKIRFIHACRHGGVHAFKKRLQLLSGQHSPLKSHVFYEQPRHEDTVNQDAYTAGRINIADRADDVILQDADYYLCGPIPFMQAQLTHLKKLGVLQDRIHLEAFGSGGFAVQANE